MIRNYIAWSCALWEKLHATKGYQIVTEPLLSPFSFRYLAAGVADLDGLNLRLVGAINMDGRIYVTQTRVDCEIVLRFQAGQFECTERDVAAAYKVITEIVRGL